MEISKIIKNLKLNEEQIYTRINFLINQYFEQIHESKEKPIVSDFAYSDNRRILELEDFLKSTEENLTNKLNLLSQFKFDPANIDFKISNQDPFSEVLSDFFEEKYFKHDLREVEIFNIKFNVYREKTHHALVVDLKEYGDGVFYGKLDKKTLKLNSFKHSVVGDSITLKEILIILIAILENEKNA